VVLVNQYESVPGTTADNGVTSTLDEAQQEFKDRYEEMKRRGVRPFA